jgi:hypothetical protein
MASSLEQRMRKWIDIDGSTVMQVLLANSGLRWRDLCRTLGFEPNAPHPGPMALYNCLMTLDDAGLITADGIPEGKLSEALRIGLCDGRRWRQPKIRASESWRRMQTALKMRYLGAPRPTDAPMTVYPHFGVAPKSAGAADVFVAMPFVEVFRVVYTDCMQPAVEALKLTIRRADDFFSGNQLMQDVWSAICAAGVIIADCTSRNPNVFYEIGIAHTVGKPVILLSQDHEDIPADLRHYRYLLYTPTSPGLKDLQEKLSRAVAATLKIY